MLQAGSGLASLKFGLQENFGMKPYAMALHTTTPTGWKIESRASRNRRFCGMNSKQMVVSIGMFPPMPKPTNLDCASASTSCVYESLRCAYAVTTRKAVYELHPPRLIPNAALMRQVRLKAHCRPTMSTNTPQTKAPAVKPEENATLS